MLGGDWLSYSAAKLDAIPHEATSDVALLPEYLSRWGVGPEMRQLVAERVALLPQPKPGLADLLGDLFRHQDWDGPAAAEGVAVLTAHGCKGREFDVVFLPAFEEGIMPSLKKDSDIEEERRLAFVALTRARVEVHISWAEKRLTQWREQLSPLPSRFISEMNDKLCGGAPEATELP